MSFFSRLFGKRKKEPSFDSIERDLGTDESVLALTAGREAADHCEKLIEYVDELEDVRSEYRVLTAYLSDVETLQNLPPQKMRPLKESAEQILALNRRLDRYLNKEKKISDKEFKRMQREEKTMPITIERFRENEAYLEVLERDMGYLENEKLTWEMYGDDYRDSVRRMRILIRVLFAAAAIITVGILVAQMALNIKLLTYWIPISALIAIGAFFAYLRSMNSGREIEQCDVNLNRAIQLLNKVKIKYINVKAAVDYTMKKYRVKTSRELLKRWENYQDAVRERAKYMLNSDDLNYYTKRYMQQLHALKLYDEASWVNRPESIADPRELVEVKHSLIERRKKLRSRMEGSIEKVRKERAEVDRILEKDPAGREEIEAILDRIDRTLGTDEEEGKALKEERKEKQKETYTS